MSAGRGCVWCQDIEKKQLCIMSKMLDAQRMFCISYWKQKEAASVALSLCCYSLALV